MLDLTLSKLKPEKVRQKQRELKSVSKSIVIAKLERM